MNISRPMLAGRLRDLATLRYPCLLTPKLDGIRCLTIHGSPVSRAFKPIRNRHVAQLLATLPDNLDGELMAGEFNESQSSIMSYDGKPEFEYWVFDQASELPYQKRVAAIQLSQPWVRVLRPVLCESEADFLRFEEAALSAGHEGVISRSLDSPYKCGRATLREQWMLKFKRYEDSEAIVIGFCESFENCNSVVPNAFGLSKRPGGKSGKLPKGTLGALQVMDLHSGVSFEIGTGKGLTADLRQRIWDDQPSYLGRIVRYTHQAVGTKDRPRFPSFQGFRDADDL